MGTATAAERSWAALDDDYVMKAPKLNDYEDDNEEEGEVWGMGTVSEGEQEDGGDDPFAEEEEDGGVAEKERRRRRPPAFARAGKGGKKPRAGRGSRR